MRQAGLKVDLQAMDWQTLVSRRAKKEAPKDGGWNMFCTAWVFNNIHTKQAWNKNLARPTLAELLGNYRIHGIQGGCGLLLIKPTLLSKGGHELCLGHSFVSHFVFSFDISLTISAVSSGWS
jgi:hypothetical protein